MKQYYYPKIYKWLSIVAMLFFGSLSIIGIGLIIFDYSNISELFIFIPIILFLFSFAYMGYEFFQRCDDIITVEDSGIHVVDKDASEHSVYWNDIYTVQERAILQCMDLKNRSGDTLLKIDYQLVGFDELCEIILSKVNHSNNSRLKNNFVSSWLIRGVFIVPAVLFSGGIIGSFVSNQFSAMWGFAGFVLFSIIGYLWVVKRIIVEENSITINNFFKGKTIKYSDINDVILKNDRDGKGNLISTVFLFISDKKPIKIAGIQGGSLAVYESIKTAWEKERLSNINEKK